MVSPFLRYCYSYVPLLDFSCSCNRPPSQKRQAHICCLFRQELWDFKFFWGLFVASLAQSKRSIDQSHLFQISPPVGVRNLIKERQKYLFRSLYTKQKALLRLVLIRKLPFSLQGQASSTVRKDKNLIRRNQRNNPDRVKVCRG